MKIPMVDLKGQYLKLKQEIDQAIQECLTSTRFIGGPQVENFSKQLAQYLGVKHVIPCANGTDAIQIALMSLNLRAGDEVIVPAFTYVATAEVIGLLGLTPVMIDVDDKNFNITKENIIKAISNDTKAIVPVHLFGQSAPMEDIMEITEKYDLFIIEDNAQSLGADYIFADGSTRKAGTLGTIGTTSFFPSKNLGAYGDGGAMFTDDDALAEKLKVISNHGQSKLYHHDRIGVNSRLDALQAAILSVKLKYYEDFIQARQAAAQHYDKALADLEAIELPHRVSYSNHIFHQYTIKVKNGKRDELKQYLADKGIASAIYYPIPLNKQKAFIGKGRVVGDAEVTQQLCEEVLSLPIHTEMSGELLEEVSSTVKSFF